MEENKNYFERPVAMLNFAKMGKLIIKDLKNNKEYSNLIKKYTKDEVVRFVETPERYQKQLRDISMFLYIKSPHYKRLCRYFSDMLTYDYIIEPVKINPEKVNVNTLKNQYYKLLNFIDTMNIKHEFSKISKIVYREDVFFGYEHMMNNSYFIQKLPFELCKISSFDDGCFNFAFDFSFFDRFIEKLDQYPSEFKKKYNKYRSDVSLRWQELDARNTICIKVNEEITEYCVPPFVGVFESVFDIEDFKALRKDRAEIGNYKVLVQKVPMNEKGDNVNDFLIDGNTVIDFHNRAVESLPPQVGMISSPMEIKDIDFEKDTADNDNVAKATRDYWGSAGVPEQLFSVDKTSSAGLDKSIQTDEQMSFTLLRQFERWLNRRVGFFNSSSNFRVNMLDITTYNRQEFFDRIMAAVAVGVPAKTMACAAIGMTPSAVINMAFFENEVLGLPDKFIPVVSAHTQSGSGSGSGSAGAPKKASIKLSPEGLKARDQGKGK